LSINIKYDCKLAFFTYVLTLKDHMVFCEYIPLLVVKIIKITTLYKNLLKVQLKYFMLDAPYILIGFINITFSVILSQTLFKY